MIIGMLFISSCTSTKNADNTDTELDEQSTDYNAIFESVMLQDDENYEMKRITNEGEIIQVLNDDRILLNKESNLVIYNITEDKETILVEDMWNPIISADKTTIAYENSEGIQIFNIEDKTSKLVYELKDNEISRNFIISSNNKTMLLQTIEEDKFHTMILDLKGNAKEVALQENDNFIITNLVYYTGNKLFATAEIKKEKDDVEEEELIKTTDIVMINTSNKKMTNITNMAPEDQSYFLDLFDNKILIEIIENTVNEDGITTENAIKTINTSSGELSSTNIQVENSTVLKLLSNEKEYVWLEEPEERDSKFTEKKEIKLTQNSATPKIIGTIYSDVPSSIFVEDNNIVFKSNGDIYIINISN